MVTAALTDGFVAAGHDVTLFPTADSKAAAWLAGRIPTGYEDKRLDARVGEARLSDRMVAAGYLALFEQILGAKTPRHPGSIQSIGSPGPFSHAGL